MSSLPINKLISILGKSGYIKLIKKKGGKKK